MSKCVLDVKHLYLALELERARLGYSWRLIARQMDLSPDVFVRMRRGRPPSADSLCSILWWLNHQIGAYIADNPQWRIPRDRER